jgi:D-alanyl-D-alanine dipeptidase
MRLAPLQRMRPWHGVPIDDCGEALVPLPASLLRLEPHPYASLGAPYGPGASPFQLRSGVLSRLLAAQEALRRHDPGLRLAIFDAWRPLAVQRFMVRQAFVEECLQRRLDPEGQGPELEAVRELVGRFWADPSPNPATPPPHSTGAAVDLTLADREGQPLAMGGAIDALGPISEPDHYASAASADPEAEPARWHANRERLRAAMQAVGFARHPNEWWHFSWGDQLWAWSRGEAQAVYGRVEN